MRVLQVIESSSAGSARHLIDLSLGLIRHGHHVDIAYATPRIDDRFKAGLKRVEAAGGRSFIVDIPFKVGIDDFKAAIQLRKLIKKEGPYDIIHLHSSKAGAVGRLARIGWRQKVVYTPHLLRTASPGLGRAGILIYGTLERLLDRLSHATIYVSDWEKNHALEQRLNPKKMHVVHIGLPQEQGGDRKEMHASLGIPEGTVVFGFIGRLAMQKDPLHLIRAFNELKTDAHLIMLGDGPLMEDCKAEAGPNIHFIGAADGPKWMPAFDVFVLPSLSESFPSTLLEAAGNYLPIITTDTGACGEFVLDGETGFVVPIGDRPALVEALGKLATDAELRKKMGAAGFLRLDSFSYEAFIERTLGVYQKALGNNQLGQ